MGKLVVFSRMLRPSLHHQVNQISQIESSLLTPINSPKNDQHLSYCHFSDQQDYFCQMIKYLGVVVVLRTQHVKPDSLLFFLFSSCVVLNIPTNKRISDFYFSKSKILLVTNTTTTTRRSGPSSHLDRGKGRRSETGLLLSSRTRTRTTTTVSLLKPHPTTETLP